MKNRFWKQWLFVPFWLGLIVSCNEDNHLDPVEDPLLIFFELNKEYNPSIDESIIFPIDSANIYLEAKYLKWIEGDKPELFIPSFVFKGEKLLLNGVEAESGKTPVSFADDVVCEIHSQGLIKRYVLSLICPQINTELPVMNFSVPADSIKDKEHYIETPFVFYDGGKILWSNDDEKIQIKGRGNTTWFWPKKPYKLKFPKKVDPFGNGKSEKEWVILAHDMDKSLIRNHLAFKISEVVFDKSDPFHHPKSVCFTPSSRFVNVYFDNYYHGVYQLADHKERGKNRIDVEKLGVEDGDDDQIIRGGHILETVSYILDKSINFATKKNIIIDHKYPKPDNHTIKQWQYIEDYVNLAESVLYSDSFADYDNGWRKYFDERSLANYIVVKEFCGDMDGYISTMLYKKRDCDLIFWGPVWDVDKGWGNDIRTPFEEYPPSSSLMILGGFRMHYNSDDWYGRLWKDERLRQLVSERYKNLRTKLIETFNNEIDNLPVQMRKSIEANYSVWPHDYQECSDAPTPEKTYDEEIMKIRNQMNMRLSLLDLLLQ